MIQELPGLVRYSETDESGRLSLQALVNYFQDAAELHGETLGIGYRKLKTMDLAWFLSSWQIDIRRMPEMGEKITVQTWGWKFSSIFGMRNCTLLDEKHETLACANSVWFLIDTKTGKPVRVPEDMIALYGVHPKADMDYAPRKVPDFEGGRTMESFEVGRQNLDTNHHVNNARYVAMARELLPDDLQIRRMRIEYKKQARLHDIIVPAVKKSGEGYQVSLRDGSGEPFVNAEFTCRSLQTE